MDAANLIVIGVMLGTTVLYFVGAGALVFTGNKPLALAYVCYGVANLALLWGIGTVK